VILAPLVLVFGVSLFYLLLDQITLPFPEFRFVVIGSFSVVACLPMVFVFMLPGLIPLPIRPTIRKPSRWSPAGSRKRS